MLGWFGSDLVDSVEDVATSAWDDVKKTVPGAQEMSDAIDAVVTGPVRDFAHTAVGRVFLSAVASTLTGGLAPFLGPQLATVAFALPGLAKGDDFVTAWTQEFSSRVQQTAAILGPDAAGPYFKDQLDRANQWIASNGIDLTQIDFRSLAQAAGIREDVAAWILAGAAGDLDLFQPNAYDPVTGKHVPTSTPIQKAMAIAEQAAQRAAQIAAAKANQKVQVRAIPYGTTSFGGDLRAQLGLPSPSVAAPQPTTQVARPTDTAAPSSTAKNVAIGIGIAGVLGAAFWYLGKR